MSKINIISLEQHVESDENIFFMRIHADITNMSLDQNAFSDFINEIISKLKLISDNDKKFFFIISFGSFVLIFII